MIYNFSEIKKIKKHYHENGFVGVTGLFKKNELKELESSIENSSFNITLEKPTFESNDIVLKSNKLLEFCYKEEIIDISSALLNTSDIEIQHSKYNSKPLDGSGEIELHQDFPFFPHTNDSLLAMGIHIDGSSLENGCIQYHTERNTVYSHFDKDKNFIGKISNPSEVKSIHIPFIGPKGVVSFHHCLTPHFSKPSNNVKRRLAIVQLRCATNKQVGGPIWKCGGINITNKSDSDTKMIFNEKKISIRNLWEPKEYFERNMNDKNLPSY